MSLRVAGKTLSLGQWALGNHHKRLSTGQVRSGGKGSEVPSFDILEKYLRKKSHQVFGRAGLKFQREVTSEYIKLGDVRREMRPECG